jgi:hypothetical protein
MAEYSDAMDPASMPTPDPAMLSALMSRPRLMQLIMQLQQLTASADQAALQAAAETGDPAAIAGAMGVAPEQLERLQELLTKEMMALAEENPAFAASAASLAEQMGVAPPESL